MPKLHGMKWGNEAALLFCARLGWFHCNLSRSSFTFKRWFTDFTSSGGVERSRTEAKERNVSQSGRKGFKRRSLCSVSGLKREDLKRNGGPSFRRAAHRFLMSTAPRKAFLGMDWMKFSLKSLWKTTEGSGHTSGGEKKSAFWQFPIKETVSPRFPTSRCHAPSRPIPPFYHNQRCRTQLRRQIFPPPSVCQNPGV